MPVATQHVGRVASSTHALRLGDPALGDVTFLQRVRGGTVVADVTSVNNAPDHFARKHISDVHNEDFEVQVGMGLSSGLFGWIADSWGAQPSARDGAVLACDYQHTIKSERGFLGALIRETTFPAFDSSSKSAGYLTIRVAPRALLPADDPGTKLSFGGSKQSKQKLWLTSNFQLQIDGLDCTKVSRVAPFTVRRPIEVVTSGGGSSLQAGPIDFPSIRVTFSVASAASWVSWHESFVVAGDNGPAAERNGSLRLLGPNLAELARIDLLGLGIFRLTSGDDEPSSAEQIVRLTADLYCEQMILTAGGPP